MDFESLEESKKRGEVSLLLLADSGYAPLNPSEWVDALKPQLIILSVAADDDYGLPDESVLDAVEGYSLLRTDLNGWLHITTDGEQMWVESERQ